MTVETTLLSEAQGISLQLAKSIHSLQKEISTLRAELEAKEASFQQLRTSGDRYRSYQLSIKGQFQCPRCWVANGKHADLKPASGGTDDEDHWNCPACGTTFVTPG